MRKLSVLLAILLFVSCAALPARAQNRVGIIGGANVGTLHIDNLESAVDVTGQTGGALGIAGDVGFTPDVFVRVEPMWIGKGAKLSFTRNGTLRTYKVKLSYFEVPMALKFMFGRSHVRPYLLGGPTAGFLLSAKRDSTVGANTGAV